MPTTRSGKGKDGLKESVSPETAPKEFQSHLTPVKSPRKLTRSSSNTSLYSQIFVGGPHPVTATVIDSRLLVISGLVETFQESLKFRKQNPSRNGFLGKEELAEDETVSQAGLRDESFSDDGRPSGQEDDHDSQDDQHEDPEADAEAEDSPAIEDSENYIPSRRSRGGRNRMRGRGKGRGRNRRSAIGSKSSSNPKNGTIFETSEGVPSSNASLYDAEDGHERRPDYQDSVDNQIANELKVTVPLIKQEGSGMSEGPPSNSGRSTENKKFDQNDEDDAIETLEHIDDNLLPEDLPAPFRATFTLPKDASECSDEADFLMKTRFKPMIDPQELVNALTKYPPSARSTESLYALALNTQRALKAWQDQYVVLDARTASHAHPPKKPATGGRVPIDRAVFEDMKEADLYNYAFDPKKAPGMQNPFAQRLGRDGTGGRELRRRAAREVAGSTALSEEDDGGNEAIGKRKRRAVQRFEGTATPEFGSRGWRKRMATGSETPEVEVASTGRGRKRSRRESTYLPQRVREMRGESIAGSVTSEGEGETTTKTGKRRGRPPGSKNLQRRSDAGIKKGPRKKKTGSESTQALERLDSEGPEASAHAEEEQGEEGEKLLEHEKIHEEASAAEDNDNENDDMENDNDDDESYTPGQKRTGAGDSANQRRKQKVKSEKRSVSMTNWWANRKARAAELKAQASPSPAFLAPSPNSGSAPTATSPTTGPPPRPRPLLPSAPIQSRQQNLNGRSSSHISSHSSTLAPLAPLPQHNSNPPVLPKISHSTSVTPSAQHASSSGDISRQHHVVKSEGLLPSAHTISSPLTAVPSSGGLALFESQHSHQTSTNTMQIVPSNRADSMYSGPSQ